jgi:predicted phage terminase large subunit-like protein
MRWVTEVDNEKKTQNDKMGHILSMPSEYIVTGLGGDLIIIDDPISAKNARSLAHCDKVWESITGTLFSRLDNKQKGGILAVSQRVSEADVIGRLQDTGQYVNVVIPAIATQDSTYIFPRSGETWYRKTGDILNPDLEPIEVLQEIREYNEGAFLCQYQQQPLVQGNGVISFQSISTFTQAENNYEKIILSADTASSVSKSAANWALGVFGLWTKNGKKCLDVLHCHANQYEYPQGKRKVEELIETYNVDEVLVENKSTGTALIPQLKEAGYNVISIKVTKSKEERAMSCSSFINSGRLRLPCREAMPWTEAWTPLFRYEIQGFPHAKTRDVLDCTTQVINHYQGQRVDLRRFYGL